MNHIELFAGCGGLSLGLKHCGYKLTMANELSPMAAESFAYNFLNENLEELARQEKVATNTLWINSSFNNLKRRLRENPFNFPEFKDYNGYSDLPKDWSELNGKLVVGSIVELNKLLDSNPELVEQLKTSFGHERGLDLVSGGPPCQSFSMAGLREKNSDKNTLPWEFAKFVKHTQPKIALLENVTGILRAFKDEDGTLFHAWYEVAKAFAAIGYVPLCLHINARLSGIAQNRPRFILIAVRIDHYEKLARDFEVGSANSQLFTQPYEFYNLVKKQGDTLPFGHLDYFDVKSVHDKLIIDESFLSSLVNHDPVSVSEALGDLKHNYPEAPSDFINNLNATFNRLPQRNEISNHDFRNNGEVVQRRFRLYQVLADINDRSVTKTIFTILRGESEILTDSSWEQCRKYRFLQLDGTLKHFDTELEFIEYLKAHPTKKQTQKALIASSPAPAALSIPDDACHYDEHELRVLTVREMARIQSFPDNFVFRSKVTTGGQMRKYEVPQYTQVGNAVPPLLGLRLGQCIAHLLD
ncbi:DNA (cytosine-5-)-methyltransferase [Vibrio europaeus]|uniref:Cytosine-specific methyltransferase n=1 Tax=Vibrio europaeus TaxID=300876 RepID=A0AAE7DVV1_9VIBR|nr:DNA (cytosine-5-)-methyltransferase [Vibrio europaeus]MDC5803447.1 DNA (cytosine-5-)-methyltransferase [Vibrio europaeus]MDC5823319.1 DNA (cytosine-5-)-methyltransferase [Vibrio europaeus]MDC5828842.1 DNA (cytosine-5-)-methyltransferase [Vibrio europaeus]MDC5833053.1 DNA (cytosine-5-)-methyltransferase [Vibrio europaeus]QJY35799.1 DNA cytosine methyltransferase [Vibrio europaeus]